VSFYSESCSTILLEKQTLLSIGISEILLYMRKLFILGKLASNLVVLMVLIAFSFFGGMYIGGLRETSAETVTFWQDLYEVPPVGVDFAPFYKAWNLLDERFVAANSATTTTEKASSEDLLWGAIAGLTKSYGDPYTVFLPPEDKEIFEDDIRGSFGGVGMEIGMQDDVLTVVAPLKDSPAEKAGLFAGDKIIRIDGESTEGKTVEEGVRNIRGEIGTKVVLTIARKGVEKFFDVEIVRNTIRIPTLESEIRADGIFVIELYNFGATSPNEFRNALRGFLLSESNKLLLDLRGNPGGYLEASVDIASWFLPTGKLVVQEHFGEGKSPRFYRSKGYNVFDPHAKMAILVNQGSASASEILAGALQDHKVGTLIGEKTFGKGSVQELVDVTSKTSLKITIAQWLTANGRSISDGGLTPDIEVELTAEDFENERDPQKVRAIEYLLTGQ
jgi:carboxyl-terminal processing protease